MTGWVIKVGGNVVDRPEALAALLSSLAACSDPWVLVHGGGKLATELAERLGLPQTLIEGRRVTDADTLRIATMVYAGGINKSIVAQLQALGVRASGLTGADGDLIRSVRRPPVQVNGATVDYGYVGDPVAVRAEVLTALWQTGQRPVVAPITHDGAGQLLNTNADTVAQVLAVGLAQLLGSEGAVRLVFAFEKAGVLRNPDDAHSLIPQIAAGELEDLKASGVVSGGMLPKLSNAFTAIAQGVSSVSIAHADALPDLLAGRPRGTLLTA